MAARNNRDHVIRNLLTCFETAARKVGVDQLFKFGAYDELRREQAVRLSALTVSPLNELWTEIGKFMASSDVTGIKPTEWRSAVLLFIGKKPNAKRDQKHTDQEYARYVAKQLVVILCHLRRIVTNEVKFKNSLNVASPDCRKAGKALRQLFQQVWSDGATPASCQKNKKSKSAKGKTKGKKKDSSRKRKASSLGGFSGDEMDSWPDVGNLVVPDLGITSCSGPHTSKEGAEEETLTEDPEVGLDMENLEIDESKGKNLRVKPAASKQTVLKRPSVLPDSVLAKASKDAEKLAGRAVSAKKGGQKEETLMKESKTCSF